MMYRTLLNVLLMSPLSRIQQKDQIKKFYFENDLIIDSWPTSPFTFSSNKIFNKISTHENIKHTNIDGRI